MNHEVGDLVYYSTRADKKGWASRNQSSIGIITEYFENRDCYSVKWLNEDDELYQRPLMKEFTSTMIVWLKRDLQEVLGNGGTQNR